MGPATEMPGVLEALVDNGMNVARFNFSHGDQSVIQQDDRTHGHILIELCAGDADGMLIAGLIAGSECKCLAACQLYFSGFEILYADLRSFGI